MPPENEINPDSSAKKTGEIAVLFKKGVVSRNPSLVLMLGMCPLLAVSTSLKAGIAMGASLTVVLVLSGAANSLLGKVIPAKMRALSYILVAAVFTVLVDFFLRTFMPSISSFLGIYLPLLAVNCAILFRAETYASKNSVHLAAIDGFATGLGFTVVITVLSLIREVLGSGAFWGFNLFGSHTQPIAFLAMPAGGLLLLAFIIASWRKVVSVRRRKIEEGDKI